MFERILLAVDDSEHSERAIRVAGEMAKRFGSEVLVLNVREVMLMTRSSPIGKETSEQSLSMVRAVAKRLIQERVNARGESSDAVESGAAGEILEKAEEFKANLIVMGTRGHSEIAGLLLGSVVSKVLHHAESSVTVVR